MKKAIITTLLATMALTAAVPVQAKTYSYKSMDVKVTKHTAKVYWKGNKVATYRFKRKPSVKFVGTDKLTYKKLANRKGRTLYIEICTGKVLDNKGNGRVDTKSKYNYISYKRTGFRKGSKVRTYLVYSPYNNYEDDITERFDEGK